MKRLSLSKVLAGVVCVLGLAAIPGVGCGGGGVSGEYSSLCHTQCTTWDDCENFTKIVVDIDACLSYCDTNSDNAQASAENKCSNYDIATAQIDGCHTSLSKLDQACLNKNQGDYNTYVKYALDDCSLKITNPQLNPDYFVGDYVRCP
ncbi:MAG: hypothetical protein U0441_27955 [Polyangiaceae bacterium]